MRNGLATNLMSNARAIQGQLKPGSEGSNDGSYPD